MYASLLLTLLLAGTSIPLCECKDYFIVATNLTVTSRDLIQTLHWDTSLPKEEWNFTVFQSDNYFSPNWTATRECTGIAATQCTFHQRFEASDVLHFHVARVGDTPVQSNDEYSFNQDNVTVFQIIYQIDDYQETSEGGIFTFSSPKFSVKRTDGLLQLGFRPVRAPWWNGTTLAERVEQELIHDFNYRILYYGCDSSEMERGECPGNTTRKESRVIAATSLNYSLHSTEPNVEYLCVEVQREMDDAYQKISSKFTKHCVQKKPQIVKFVPYIAILCVFSLGFVVAVTVYCHIHGKHILYSALKLRSIEIPNSVDQVLQASPSISYHQTRLTDINEKEIVDPLPIRDGSFSRLLSVSSSADHEWRAWKVDENVDEEEDIPPYSDMLVLGKSPSSKDNIEYTEVLRSEMDDGSSSVGYMTLAQRLSAEISPSLNVCGTGLAGPRAFRDCNLDDKVEFVQHEQHVCNEDCGYASKDATHIFCPRNVARFV